MASGTVSLKSRRQSSFALSLSVSKTATLMVGLLSEFPSMSFFFWQTKGIKQTFVSIKLDTIVVMCHDEKLWVTTRCHPGARLWISISKFQHRNFLTYSEDVSQQNIDINSNRVYLLTNYVLVYFIG